MSLTEDLKVVKHIIFSFHIQNYTKKTKKNSLIALNFSKLRVLKYTRLLLNRTNIKGEIDQQKLMKTCKSLSGRSISIRLHVKNKTFAIAVKLTVYGGVAQPLILIKI